MQAVHAAVEHALARPDLARSAPTVAVLGVRDELRLGALLDDLRGRGLAPVGFHEPDLGGELTALAVVSGRRCAPLRRLRPLFNGEEVRT